MTSGIRIERDKKEAIKKRVVESLREGNPFYTACSKSGVSKTEAYRWRKEEPDFDKQCKQARYEGEEANLDKAENILHKKIFIDEDRTATIFYLKTKGKNRGYVERQERAVKDDSSMDVIAEEDAKILEQLGL